MANKPKDSKFTKISDGMRRVGHPVDLHFEGRYKNGTPAADKKVHVMIRVTYRIKGVPTTQTVYSKETRIRAATPAFFEPDLAAGEEMTSFTPVVAGPHFIQLLAWDSKFGPADGVEHDKTVVRLLVK